MSALDDALRHLDYVSLARAALEGCGAKAIRELSQLREERAKLRASLESMCNEARLQDAFNDDRGDEILRTAQSILEATK
jgi:hypothetical protein